jgi:hypothetical protein
VAEENTAEKIARLEQDIEVLKRENELWYARIPSGSHVTEMLALICSAYVTWKSGKPARLAENTPQPD